MSYKFIVVKDFYNFRPLSVASPPSPWQLVRYSLLCWQLYETAQHSGGWCVEEVLAPAAWVDQHSNMMTFVECDSLVFSKEGEMVDFVQRRGLTPIMLSSRVGWLMVWLVDQWPMDRKDSQRGKGEEDGRVTSMLHSGDRRRVRWAEGWRVEQMDFFCLIWTTELFFFA